MTVEKALNSIKGTIIDYNMDGRATLYVLVKSKAGKYSIRQAFRNAYGEYKGFQIVKLLGGKDENLAKLDFEELITVITNR